MILTFESVDESVINRTKAIEQYLSVVLLLEMNIVVLTFKTVDRIAKCDHSNKTC